MSNKIVMLQDGSDNIYPLGKSNENLLDNPFFTVNQRGQTTYGDASATTDTRLYCVDRWITRLGSAEVVSNGIKSIENSGTGNTKAYLLQPIEDYTELLGKTITITVNIPELSLSDGEVITSTFYSGTSAYGATTRLCDLLTITEAGTYKMTTTMADAISSSHSFVNFSIRINYAGSSTGAYFVLRSAKVEYGNASTLHLDSEPNYSDELWKCQRYYQLFATSSFRPTYAKDCRPEMRATPTQGTITISGTTYYYNDANL